MRIGLKASTATLGLSLVAVAAGCASSGSSRYGAAGYFPSETNDYLFSYWASQTPDQPEIRVKITEYQESNIMGSQIYTIWGPIVQPGESIQRLYHDFLSGASAKRWVLETCAWPTISDCRVQATWERDA